MLSSLGTELQRQRQNFIRGFKTHRMLYAVSILFLIYAYAVCSYVGVTLDLFSGAFFLLLVATSLLIAGLALLILRFVRLIFIERPDNPTQVLGRWLIDTIKQEDRLTNIVHMIIILWPFLMCFSNVKSAIPLIQPFAWDEAFMRLDLFLHAGWHPWELLQPIFGTPLMTIIVNSFYNFWFFAMFFCLFLQGFAARNTHLRQQFLTAFMLAWTIGGSVLAIAFSSAGPAYYTRIGLKPDPYTPLMSYLHQANEIVPVWALEAQDILWEAYTGADTLVSGISAMPSLHVTIAVLQAIMGWKVNRWLGLLLTAYAVMIMLGSVHLAWHYAVDGYLGFIVAWACWWTGGRLAHWNQPQTR